MSHRRPKRYEMWMEGAAPFPPEISNLLPKIILELAILEDVAGPWASEVHKEEYIAKLATRLREPVMRELAKAGVSVSLEEVAKICSVSASETFVIRRLNEARLGGEVLVDDFRHLPFYRTYQDYFEQTPEILARVIAIALNPTASEQPNSSMENPGPGTN